MPRAMAGRIRCRIASTNSAGPVPRQERVDQDEVRLDLEADARVDRGRSPAASGAARRRCTGACRPSTKIGMRYAEQRDDGDERRRPSPAHGAPRSGRAGSRCRPRRSCAATVSSIVAGKRDEQLVEDRPVVDDALAEVALEQLREVVEVLLVERLVEAEVLAHRSRASARASRAARGATSTGSPGSRWTNANRRMDRPNRTGMAPMQSPDDVLQHAGGQPRSLRSDNGIPGAGGPGDCGDALEAGRRLLVEPDAVTRLVEVPGAHEALDVGGGGSRRLRVTSGTVGRSRARMSWAFFPGGLGGRHRRWRRGRVERGLQLRRARTRTRGSACRRRSGRTPCRGSCPGPASHRSSRGATPGTSRRTHRRGSPVRQPAVLKLTVKPTASRSLAIASTRPFGSGMYGRATSDGYQKLGWSGSPVTPDAAISGLGRLGIVGRQAERLVVLGRRRHPVVGDVRQAGVERVDVATAC